MIIKIPGVLLDLAQTLFARRNRSLLLSSFALIVTVDWLSTSTHLMIDWLLHGDFKTAFPWIELFYPVLFALAFIWAKSCYRRLSAASTLSVEARYNDCDGLVLFLSKAYKDPEMGWEERDLEQLENAARDGATLLLDPAWRDPFKSHLRMPLEALAFHFGGKAGKRIPQRVTLLASNDSVRFAPQVRDAFESLIRPLANDTQVISIEGVGTGNWRQGIDYRNPGQVVAVLEAVYADYEGNDISPGEVIVDVTGGTALGSVIASMTALKSGRRVQYTSSDSSRKNYSVKVFDLEYTESIKGE
jgi:hypothetical protein